MNARTRGAPSFLSPESVVEDFSDKLEGRSGMLTALALLIFLHDLDEWGFASL